MRKDECATEAFPDSTIRELSPGHCGARGQEDGGETWHQSCRSMQFSAESVEPCGHQAKLQFPARSRQRWEAGVGTGSNACSS
eukprot:2216891-Rhodomonas_salina.1